jgi:acyl dehydratase
MRASVSPAAPTRPLANTIFPFGPGMNVADAMPGNTPRSRTVAAAVRPERTARRYTYGSRSGRIRPNMSTDTHQLETDQAAREASGAHPYGRYLEEFEVGDVYKHWPAKTVTESDDHLFCLITMNHHPLHLNDVYAGRSQQGQNVVVGPLVYSLALGMSVSDVSGKAIANLATEELSHPAPVFHGDTLFVESEVLEKKESRSKPDRGTVKVHTRVYKQDGTLVAEFKRLVLVPRKNPGQAAPPPDANVE